MSEIDGLKALLDGRGEPYVVNDFGVTWQYHSDPHTATESMDGTLIVTGLTPEQAVDATLGRGECHVAPFGTCSECGAQLDGIYERYCPNCGRKVVDA